MNPSRKIDLDERVYPTALAAHGAGEPLETVLTRIKRGDLELLGDERPGTGRERRFSLRRVMHLALIARLTRHGAKAKQAAEAAQQWTDVGRLERLPLGLFAKGQTYFIARVDRDGNVPEAEVTNSDSLLRAFALAGDDTIAAVHMNQLYMDVCKRLGIIE